MFETRGCKCGSEKTGRGLSDYFCLDCRKHVYTYICHKCGSGYDQYKSQMVADFHTVDRCPYCSVEVDMLGDDNPRITKMWRKFHHDLKQKPEKEVA